MGMQKARENINTFRWYEFLIKIKKKTKLNWLNLKIRHKMKFTEVHSG